MSASSRIFDALEGEVFLSQDVARLAESHKQQAQEIDALKAANHALEIRLVRLEEWRTMLMAMAGARTTKRLPASPADE